MPAPPLRNPERPHAAAGRDRRRKVADGFFSVLCLLAAGLAVVILTTLLVAIFTKGGLWIDWQFLTSGHRENEPLASGIGPAIIGSALICLICAVVALPVGIGTAIFLEEIQPSSRWLRIFHGLVQLNISNLAGVPSIVYGILGVTAFVYMFGAFGRIEAGRPPAWEVGARYAWQLPTLGGEWVQIRGADPRQPVIEVDQPVTVTFADGATGGLNVIAADAGAPEDPRLLARTVRAGTPASIVRTNAPWYFHLPLHRSILAAGLTLALVILPIIIIASQEALRAVPDGIREAALGLGSTRWQAIRRAVLPMATPGIMTGAILALSRALGEAAPLLAVMGGVLSTTGLTSLMDRSPTLPVAIYRWSHDENPMFENLAAAAIIVLLVLLLLMNAVAVLIRYRAERQRG